MRSLFHTKGNPKKSKKAVVRVKKVLGLAVYIGLERKGPGFQFTGACPNRDTETQAAPGTPSPSPKFVMGIDVMT